MKIKNTQCVYYYILIFSLHLLLTLPSYSQQRELLPQSSFSRDSVKIGDTIRYSLSVRHHIGSQVLFPDTSFNFEPFELIKKSYYPTVTKDSISLDSAVYVLTTFELEPVLSLSLPIYLLKEKDSITFYSPDQSVYLITLIETLPDSLVLQTDDNFREVELAFNYPFVGIGLAAFAFILLIIIVFFSKRIRYAIKLLMMKRRYQHFMKMLSQMQQDLLKENSANQTEKMISFWKKYLEKLTNIPFTTYTTKEINEILKNQELGTALQQTDRYIYGGKKIDNLDLVIAELKQTATDLYKEQRKEVVNGK